MRSIFRILKANPVKTIIGVLLLAVITCIMIAQFIDPFSFRETRISPHDFPGSEWQCEEPFISLHVKENNEIGGYIIIDGERINVDCPIDWGRFILMTRTVEGGESVRASDYLFEGKCDCTAQQIIIKIEKDYIFGGRYDEIVLIRVN